MRYFAALVLFIIVANFATQKGSGGGSRIDNKHLHIFIK